MGNPEQPTNTAQPGLVRILQEVTRKLTSQPLIYGFAILLILAIIASVASDSLRVLLIPAVAIFTLGALVWLTAEYVKLRNKPVRLRARRVARGAKIAGATGARSPFGIDVEIRATDIGDEAHVVGIEFAQQPPTAADAPRVDDNRP